MYWQDLTSPALAAVERKTPVVLPIAAIEQHGPHLPLATDRLINEFFCQELERELPHSVLILPIVAVGCSSHHMDFPGTLTLTHETMIAQVLEILESVNRHRFLHLIVLNSHGGNQGAGQVVLERFGAAHPQSKIVLATWWKLASAALLALNETGPGGVGHACEFETSLIQLIAPHLVDARALSAGPNTDTFEWAESDMLRSPAAALYRSMKQMTPNGVYGRPDKASPAKGQAIRDAVVAALRRIVLDLGK